MKMSQRFILLWFGASVLSACQSITHIPDPNNTYTPETTYQKLVGDYPFISIPSTLPTTGVTEIKNLTYVRYGRRALQLDLYLPRLKKAVPRPAVVFVHGGGWRAGYRTNFTPFAIAMAERGYVAATISYRLSSEAQYPAAIHDVKAAVRWLRTKAGKYGLDPTRIAVAGGSAGGQIASLVGVTNGLAKFDPQARQSKVSSEVQAIVDIDGLINFTAPEALVYENDPRKNPSAAGAWFGGSYEQRPELWREASPLFYVNDKTPPILFLISAQLRFTIGYQEMMAQMHQLGRVAERVQIPDTPHSFWLFDPWLQPSVDAVDQFLQKIFDR